MVLAAFECATNTTVWKESDMIDRVLVLGLALIGAVPLGGCTTNAATGRSQLVFMSREREIALGEESMSQLTAAYGGAYASGSAQSYLTEVGLKMAALTEADNPTLPWEFTLLDSDVVNAFALPGGKVFVSRELISRLDDEAELACVVGHEIGHVTAQHVDERISRQMIVAGAAIAAGVAAQESDTEWVRRAAPAVVGAGAGGYMLKFGRDQELEADTLGMRYAARAGYDPGGLVGVLEVLKEESGGGGDALKELFSTHPDPDHRLAIARKRLAEKYDGGSGARARSRFQSEFQPILAAGSSGKAGVSWCGVCGDDASEAVAALAAE